MKIQSFDKTLHNIIREIADAYNISLDLLADNRVIELTNERYQRHIIGYYFDLNDSASWMAARFKDISSSILNARGIPHVEHKIFRNPKAFSDNKSNWSEMMEFAEKYDYKIVCKPNAGSLGAGVTYITSLPHLEEVITKLFSEHAAITLSPYYDIRSETRFVVLDNECILIYQKERPFLRGNSKETVAGLLQRFISSFDTLGEVVEFFKLAEMKSTLASSISLNDIPREGENILMHWKHNASKLAPYNILENSPFHDLAVCAASALNLKFASIDVVDTAMGPKVLEANAGVCLKRLYKDHYATVRTVYSRAIRKMFQIE